jgi:hypothetical protein
LKNAQVTYDAENAVRAGERGFKLVENFDGSPAAAVSVALRELVGETGNFPAHSTDAEHPFHRIVSSRSTAS